MKTSLHSFYAHVWVIAANDDDLCTFEVSHFTEIKSKKRNCN